jgi:hypothetical protein
MKTGLAQEKLRQEAGNFESQKRRGNYLEMRMEGWLIGSGTVESGAKQGSFYRSRDALETGLPGKLIQVRSAIMSDTFGQLWRKIYYSPLN